MREPMTPVEASKLKDILEIADRAGERSQLHAAINRIMVPFVAGLVVIAFACLGMAKIVSLEGEIQSQAQAATMSTSVSSAAIVRSRKVLNFLCSDLAWEDAFRTKLHALDERYHPSRDAFLTARDALIAQRDQHAHDRREQCAKLLTTL